MPTVDPAIQEQIQFVEWLKEKGLYNPIESAATMQKMHSVWLAARAGEKNTIQVLTDDDQWWVGMFNTKWVTQTVLLDKEELSFSEAVEQFGQEMVRIHLNNPHLKVFGAGTPHTTIGVDDESS